MNIEVYALCHQEAKIIPYFMRHYTQFASVTLFEGYSTDGSKELAESLGAKVVFFESHNETRDDLMIDVKNNCWKQSQADWVIIADMDEFVYHPNLPKYLSTIKDTIILPRCFEMFSRKYPTTKGQIYEEVCHGIETRSKMCVFQPRKLKEIAYGAGCHDALPEGEVYINRTSEIKLLHMRHLSVEHIVERNKYLAGRMSEINKRMGWGWHVSMPEETVYNYYAENQIKLMKVVP